MFVCLYLRFAHSPAGTNPALISSHLCTAAPCVYDNVHSCRYESSTLLAATTDEMFDAILNFSSRPVPGGASGTIIIFRLKGAIARVPTIATAFAHRNAEYWMLTLAKWKHTPTQREPTVAWVRSMNAAVKPWMSGTYNTLSSAVEGGGDLPFGESDNFTRLKDIKAKFDPDNFFRMNNNIKPVPLGKPSEGAEGGDSAEEPSKRLQE